MTANVFSAGAVETVDAPPPVISHSSHDEDDLVDDRTIGRAATIGFLGGVVFMTVLSFAFGLLAGIDAATSAAVAPIPGVVAGLFVGMTAYLGGHIARAGHRH